MKMKKLLFSLFLFISSVAAHSQQQTINDSLERIARFEYSLLGNKISLKPQTPPLIQLAGAPQGYYTYHWEFGDGHYSTEEYPTHHYKEPGIYEVSLWATNNYDAGKAPATRPQKVEVSKVTKEASASAAMSDKLELGKNREPVPSEDMVVIISYKNDMDYLTNGRIYLFYNEKKYRADNFELADIRSHYGEKEVSNEPIAHNGKTNPYGVFMADAEHGYSDFMIVPDSAEKSSLAKSLEDSKTHYRNQRIFEFDAMPPKEERNIFLTLRTTPEMLKDTSALITIRGIYVPDRTYDNHSVKELELEIVTSHDPNRMSTNANLMDFRSVKDKHFKYKIQFQNNGEGPANTIRLETEIPKMFDISTLSILDLYPKCPICPKEEDASYSCIDTTYTDGKAIFTFRNIYLPGSRQANVQAYDSTKGFVAYQIQLNPKIHKQKTKSRTAIYFDKNEPIITNYAVTRFVPGISVGAKAGYISAPDRNAHREYFVGATISPYKAYRGYLQAELMFSSNTYNESDQYTEVTDIDEVFAESFDYNVFTEYQNISMYIIPASYHYNLSNFLAVESGLQLRYDLSSIGYRETTGEYTLIIRSEQFERRDESHDTFAEEEIRESFTNFQTGLFLGVNIGSVRAGPSVGLRYVRNFNAPTNQFQWYAVWKF